MLWRSTTLCEFGENLENREEKKTHDKDDADFGDALSGLEFTFSVDRLR